MTDATGTSDTILVERIRARISALDTAPVTAAVYAGLHRNYIHDILNGKKTGMSAKALQRVSAALRCTVGYLLGETDETGDPAPGEPLARPVPAEDHDPVERVIVQHRSGRTRVYKDFIATD